MTLRQRAINYFLTVLFVEFIFTLFEALHRIVHTPPWLNVKLMECNLVLTTSVINLLMCLELHCYLFQQCGMDSYSKFPKVIAIFSQDDKGTQVTLILHWLQGCYWKWLIMTVDAMMSGSGTPLQDLISILQNWLNHLSTFPW